MNEEEVIEKIKWSIQINNATKEINGDNTSINVQVLETALNLLEKKDKIINELEDIFYNYQLCEYELTDCTYRKCEYIADDENPPCKECIKQYFENKVKE